MSPAATPGKPEEVLDLKWPLVMDVAVIDAQGQLVGSRAFQIRKEQLEALLLTDAQMKAMTGPQVEAMKKAVTCLQMAASQGAQHAMACIRKAALR